MAYALGIEGGDRPEPAWNKYFEWFGPRIASSSGKQCRRSERQGRAVGQGEVQRAIPAGAVAPLFGAVCRDA